MGQIRDIPYISTVWDLAHRIYPFFPEVSLYGEFGRQEDMYRRYLQRASYVIARNQTGEKEVIAFYQVAEDREPSRSPAPARPRPARILDRKRKERAFNSTPNNFARELIKLFDEFALYRRTWPSAYDDVELTP